MDCLLYTSDAADERSSVALGGRRIIKKKHNTNNKSEHKNKTKNKDRNRDKHPQHLQQMNKK